MADDVKPILPDRAQLEARARKAGINLETLSELARSRLVREFYTSAELAQIEKQSRAEIAEDVRRYNEYVARFGIWNAKFRGW